jgi:HpcH/HpaI aldolase/citrate lyase family
MIDFLQITNQPDFARRCDAMPGMRLFVDLERDGKADRQKGRNTFITTHGLDDVGHIRACLTQSRLMVRVNPIRMDAPEVSRVEIDAVLARGADLLMLPMFTTPDELQAFCALVDGRVPVIPLLETAGALLSAEAWVATPNLYEIYVGLNDLHISLGNGFMFEPLRNGHVARIAALAKNNGVRFGFGGIARANEGTLPGRSVLGEHLRLGSQAVILSRTFNRVDESSGFEEAVGELRRAETELLARSAGQIESDRLATEALIDQIAGEMQASA